MLLKKEIKRKINSTFGDYNIDSDDVYLIVLGKKEGTRFFTKEKILIRILERVSWYEILDLFGKEFLTKNLYPSTVGKIRNPIIRNRYEFIRKILQGKTLSNTGWSAENRKRIKASVLSHRWNGA